MSGFRITLPAPARTAAPWRWWDMPADLRALGTVVVALLAALPSAWAYGAGLLGPLGLVAVLLVDLIALAVALRRERRAMVLARRILDPRTIAPSEIPARLGRQEGIYLGEGFRLDLDHATVLHRVHASRPAREFAPPRLPSGEPTPAAARAGDTWIRVLEADGQGPVVLEPGRLVGHTLILGTTGAGKTRTVDLICAQVIARGEGLVVIDPKGDRDLYTGLAEAARRHGRTFHFFHLSRTRESVRLNPLANALRGTDVGARITANMSRDDRSQSFTAFSDTVVSTVATALLELGRRPTIWDIYRHITDVGPLLTDLIVAWGEAQDRAGIVELSASQRRERGALPDRPAEFVAYYEYRLRERAPNQAIEALIKLYRHEREHLSKMIASLIPILTTLTAGEMRELISPDPNAADPRPIIAISDVMARGEVLYIGLPSLGGGLLAKTVGTLLVSDLASAISDRYIHAEVPAAGGRPGAAPIPLHLVIDEAAEVFSHALVQILNKGRGAGVRVWYCAQSVADIETRLGREGLGQCLANTNNLMALRLQDEASRRRVLERLKTVVVERREIGHSLGRSEGDRGKTQSESSSYRLGRETQPLVPETFLGALPNLSYVLALGDETWYGSVPFLRPEPARERAR